MSDIAEVNEMLAMHASEIDRLLKAAIAAPNLDRDWLDEQVTDFFAEGASSAANQTAEGREQETALLDGEAAASSANNEGLESQFAILFAAHGEEEAVSLIEQLIEGEEPSPGRKRASPR